MARPVLAEVCATIADVQVRNRGTLGGNLCSNDPTNHFPPLMVALGATMTIASLVVDLGNEVMHVAPGEPDKSEYTAVHLPGT